MNTNKDVKILGYQTGYTKLILKHRLLNQQNQRPNVVAVNYRDSDLESVTALLQASIIASLLILAKLMFFA